MKNVSNIEPWPGIEPDRVPNMVSTDGVGTRYHC